MSLPANSIPEARSLKYTRTVCILSDYFGIGAFWITDTKWPILVRKIHSIFIYQFLNVYLLATTVLLVGGFFATDNFGKNEKWKSDNILFGDSYALFMISLTHLWYYNGRIKYLMYKLVVILKQMYNDEETEKEMLKKCNFHLFLLGFSFTVTCTMFTAEAVVKFYVNGEPLVSLPTFWPRMEDRSQFSEIVRILLTANLFVLLLKIVLVYFMVILSTIAAAYQFRLVQHYFYHLENIFTDTSSRLTQLEKEEEYIKNFIEGIKLHDMSLWCVKEMGVVYRVMYAGQISLNLISLVTLMMRLLSSNKDTVTIVVASLSVISVLLSTAQYMCNAGDITVEAAEIPYAMFSSGWHYCTNTARKVRPLLVVAICRSQVPVTIKALNILTLSYRTFVSVVRASYSIFTVILKN